MTDPPERRSCVGCRWHRIINGIDACGNLKLLIRTGGVYRGKAIETGCWTAPEEERDVD